MQTFTDTDFFFLRPEGIAGQWDPIVRPSGNQFSGHWHRKASLASSGAADWRPISQTALRWTLHLCVSFVSCLQGWRDKHLVNSPWMSFCAMFCVRMSEDRRRTSPLKTHSCTGKSCPIRIIGFLLLSSMTSDVDSVLVLALICGCWLCCCVDGDFTNLWLLKILLALLLLLALEAVNVPVAASSSGSSKSSSLLGLWSLRRERTFSPVIF